MQNTPANERGAHATSPPFLSTPFCDSNPSNFFRHQSASLHKGLLTKEKKEKFFWCSIVDLETMRLESGSYWGLLHGAPSVLFQLTSVTRRGPDQMEQGPPLVLCLSPFFLSLPLSGGWFNLTSAAN